MGLIYTDIPELEGSKTEIVLQNLSELEERFSTVVHRRLAHLCELSWAVISDGEDFDIIKNILQSMRSESEEFSTEDDIVEHLLYSQVSFAERLILYKRISEGFFSSHREALIQKRFSKIENINKDALDKIAYVRGYYNDQAYLKLGAGLKHARAVYFDTAEQVCSAVADGECEYCMLAVEANGAKLSHFYSMIRRCGFIKCAEYEMRTNDGYTRYALLRKESVIIDKGERGTRTHPKIFEFMLDADEGSSLSDVLIACEFCGMKLRRIDTVDNRICISMIMDKGDIQTLMTYIAVECPNIISLGIYKQI